jgi:large subunit ribosomal protein L25
MTFEIAAQAREAKQPLAEGLIPAVFYSEGKEATSIAIDSKAFTKMYREAGSSTIIDIKTDNGVEKALVHEVQIHPVSHKVQHVDFLTVDVTKPIQVEVSLTFVGESPAVDQNLGALNIALETVEIEVPATDMPSEIEVDISGLATLEDAIRVSDIKIPASATLISDPEALVANVAEVKEEAEEETSRDIDFDAIASDTGNEKATEEEATSNE